MADEATATKDTTAADNGVKATDLAKLDTAAGFGSPDGFVLLQRGAMLLASSTLVPDTYRNNLPNCVIALNMAQRMNADPLMVMQNLYVVHGRPGWSAQFLIACFNQCGRFSPIRYEWKGERDKDDWGCRAWAIEKATGQRVESPWVTLGMVKAEGWWDRKDSKGNLSTKWRSLTELMFHYRSATFLVRTVAPELAMGLLTEDELLDVIETKAVRPGVYEVRPDALTPEALAQAAVEARNDAPPGSTAPTKSEAEAKATTSPFTNF